jgi:cytochrome P450
MIQALRPRIQEIADQLLDDLQPLGKMDLVSQFAYPLPITVIAELIGIPVSDRMKFRVWSNAFVKPPLTPEEQQESLRLLQEFIAYLQVLVADRRQHPRDDLLSGLIHAEEQGDYLDESELFSMLTLLIVAGHETTVTFIGNAVMDLLQDPARLETLKQNPEKMAGAVDELLRYNSPVERSLTRWVTQDTLLGGQSLKKGDMIIAVLASANRDESRFENPSGLNFDRMLNSHVAFGKGAHYCLGAPLARLEGEIALNTLFRRLPDLQLDIPLSVIRWRQVPLLHSLVSLPVRWRIAGAPD